MRTARRRFVSRFHAGKNSFAINWVIFADFVGHKQDSLFSHFCQIIKKSADCFVLRIVKPCENMHRNATEMRRNLCAANKRKIQFLSRCSRLLPPRRRVMIRNRHARKSDLSGFFNQLGRRAGSVGKRRVTVQIPAETVMFCSGFAYSAIIRFARKIRFLNVVHHNLAC